MGGLGHDFKVGANWIHEPHLFATFNGGATPQLTLNSDALNSTVRQVLFNGGAADVNIPLDLYAFYVQDDWRINDRLTLNLGLRYDYVDGVPIGQEPNANFQIDAGGRRGRALHQLPAARRLRAVVAERRRQLAAARRLRLRPASATAGTSSAAGGASTPTSASPTRTCSSPPSTSPADTARCSS